MGEILDVTLHHLFVVWVFYNKKRLFNEWLFFLAKQ